MLYSVYILNMECTLGYMQLKHMINALYSSQRGGTKSFEMDGSNFRWKVIIDMYKHEIERRNLGAARMVPRLRESYVLHDAWTKLNVAPAKVMQVRFIILCAYNWYIANKQYLAAGASSNNYSIIHLKPQLLWMPSQFKV